MRKNESDATGKIFFLSQKKLLNFGFVVIFLFLFLLKKRRWRFILKKYKLNTFRYLKLIFLIGKE